jgi:hypothetical protein
MAMQETSMAAAQLSKFMIGDLALRSALELERALAGANYDKEPLHSLAAALRQSSGAEPVSGGVSHMRPGYFEPFQRVYRARNTAEPKSLKQIREFLDKAIYDIDAAADQPLDRDLASRLVDFCLEVNREFVRRQPSEDNVGRSRRSVPVEAFVR